MKKQPVDRSSRSYPNYNLTCTTCWRRFRNREKGTQNQTFIQYKKSVAKDLKNLDKAEAKRIIDRLEKELRKDPDAGEQLKGKFAGLSRLRVGDHQVIYVKTKEGVLVLLVAHRKDVCKKLERGG